MTDTAAWLTISLLANASLALVLFECTRRLRQQRKFTEDWYRMYQEMREHHDAFVDKAFWLDPAATTQED